MGRPKLWTNEKLSELMRLKAKGMLDKEIVNLPQFSNYSVEALRLARYRNLPNRRKYNRFRWTPQRVRDLYNLRRAGWPVKKIANYFDTSESNIRNVMDRFALPRRKYEYISQRDLVKIKELRDMGWTAGRIAIKLGQDRITIQSVVSYYECRAREGKGPWATVK